MNIPLKYPVTVPAKGDRPETVIKELNLADRMTAGHAEHIPDEAFTGKGVNPTRFLPAIAAMADMDLSVIKLLDYVDVTNLVGSVMMPFLEDLGLTVDQLKK